MIIRRVSAAEVRPLRRAVLRAGMADRTVVFDGDDEIETVHLAAFDDGDRMIGTSTWLRRPCPHEPEARAVQLRGMATAAHLQGHGIGSALLEAGFARWMESSDLVWANARDAALPFYRRHGFATRGTGFIEPVTELPHHVVVRFLVPDITGMSSPPPTP